jgi:hypothetical protein
MFRSVKVQVNSTWSPLMFVPTTREGTVVAEMGGQTGIFGIENF